MSTAIRGLDVEAVVRQERAALLRFARRPFRVAWPIAVNGALADLSVVEQVFWRRTFSEQKQVWSTSYSRLAWPANRRPALFVAEHEGFERSGNRRLSVAP